MHAHVIGFPRLGPRRNLKWALEKYWRGSISATDLHRRLSELRRDHWQLQANAGMTLLAAGDFAYYDQVLELSELLGAVPARHAEAGDRLERCFAMARGSADAPACQMRKWFNTNYHYLVPEFAAGMDFSPAADAGMPPDAIAQAREAADCGLPVKVALTGPLTYLYLGKLDGAGGFAPGKLTLADSLAEAYAVLAGRAKAAGAEWLQLDEPVLSLDAPAEWIAALAPIYKRIEPEAPQLLAANYFGAAGSRLQAVAELPVGGVHVDMVYGASDLEQADRLFEGRVLSAGAVDGRNIWQANLTELEQQLAPLTGRSGGLWVGSTCSLQHVPHSCAGEDELAAAGIPVAFAVEKLAEIAALARKLAGGPTAADAALLATAPSDVPTPSLGWIDPDRPSGSLEPSKRSLRPGWNGTMLPTTTIGSLPQTHAIRSERAKWRAGELTGEQYEDSMREEIRACVSKQEQLGLDILVHGECERNDMIEYFAEQLDGIDAPKAGWVLSYGSRATRPPIIHGPIRRKGPMTVKWSSFAAGLTDKPMKAMLTGPVTIICWSFPRADVPRMATAFELAEALHDEALDLQRAGLAVIQVDEPALREGLPLAEAERRPYLAQAVAAFNRIADGIGAQVHTHMCYGEFADIAEAIAAMDADVISLETSRTDMEVLADLTTAKHAGGVGPGIYDVHSPQVPSVEAMAVLLHKALAHVPAARLWVNPDCGLKTRGWQESEAALRNMVAAADQVRSELA